MDRRDWVFDVLVELCEYSYGNGLPVLSYKLEEAMDVYLAERDGRLKLTRRPPRGATFRSVRHRPLAEAIAPRPVRITSEGRLRLG